MAPSNTTSPWPRVAGLLLALALLAGGAYLGWKHWLQPANPREQYQIARVQRGDLEDLVTATGTLQPRDYVDVGAQVSGQLKKIHVEIGSIVQQGDLLAEIDPTVLLANVDAGRANLRSLQATLLVREAALVLARDQHQRQKNLMAADATTTEALRTAENNLRSAEAQLAAQKASIEQTQSTLRASEANLNYARIYAPISGAVVSITARQGQTLNANQSAPILLRVADLSTMTVQTQVSEADVGKLRVGMPVYFTTLGSQGQRWYGQLSKVEPTPTVTNNVVLYNALFDVPNADQRLMTSMTAQVFFIAAQARDALLVPAAAVQSQPRGPRRPAAPGSAAGPAATAASAAGAQAPGAPAQAQAQAQAPDRERLRAEIAQMDEAQRRVFFEQRRREREAGGTPAAEAAEPAGRGRLAGPAGPAQRGPRQATVRVIDAAGQVEERRVEVGISNRVQVQVLAGLDEGDEVIAGQRLPTAGASGARGGGTGQQRSGLQGGAPMMPPGGPR
ncbi:efflux RND transporter periplasmic adaptor subunit [Pseudorhodoferax sp.]|uniref:efflux RND transporter periplasmic adaptor subunit n=1 Tax=Pseudorhodoferax sp. TaxID=1993553 RepID=UPI0039E47B53